MRGGILLAGVVAAGALAAPAHGAPAWLPAENLSVAGESATAPRVALDAAGNAIAVWERGGVIQAATRPAGERWSAARDLSPGVYPQLAAAPDGDAVVAWNRDGRVQAATRAAGRDWTAADTLAASGDIPRVEVGAAGDVVVTWGRFNGAHWIVQAVTRPRGGGWGGVQDLSAAGQDATPADLAVDAAGGAVAVWTRYDGSHWRVQAASLDAGQWSAPRTLSAAGQDASLPQVATDPAGNATAAWSRNNGINLIVQTATRPVRGEWTSPQNRTAGGRDASGPRVAVDAAGNAHVAWERFNGSHTIAQVASRPANGSWTSARNLSAPGQDALMTRLAVNAAGDAMAVWSRTDWTTVAAVQASVRAAGGDWTPPHELSGFGFNPRVALDAAGNGVVIWEPAAPGNLPVQAAGYDAAAPRVRISTAVAGLKLSAAALARDVWSPVASVRWDLGDGTTVNGPTVTHAYRAAGDYTITATASDALGNASSASATVRVRVQPPTVVAPGPAAVPIPAAPAAPAAEWVTVTLRRTLVVPRRRGRACRGQVLATLKVGRTRLDTKAVRLDRRCRYTARFRIRRSRLNGARTVTVTVRFPGNRRLRAAPTKSYRVRV